MGSSLVIVCHCRVVSDRKVREAIACGAAGVCAVASACQAGMGCGGCLPAVRQLLADHGLPTDDHLSPADIRAQLAAEAQPARELTA